MGNYSPPLSGELSGTSNRIKSLGINVTIEENIISNTCLLNSDCGCVYVNHQHLERDNSSIIKNNLLSTGIRDLKLLTGIYIDNGTSGYTVYDNVIYDTKDAVRFNQNGENNGLYNNTFYNVDRGLVRWENPNPENPFADMEFELNVYNNLSTSDFNSLNGADTQNNLTLTENEADFLSPIENDFRISSTSQALNQGIFHDYNKNDALDGLPDVGAFELGAEKVNYGSSILRPVFNDEDYFVRSRVAYYPFEGTTQYVNDLSDEDVISDSGYLGAAVGDSIDDPERVSGMIGDGIDFSATETITIPNSYELNPTGAMSIAVFIKLNTPISSQTSDLPTLVDKHEFVDLQGYKLYFNRSSQTLVFRVLGEGKVMNASVDVGSKICTEDWCHIAAVFDGSAGTLKIYIDGDEQSVIISGTDGASTSISSIEPNNKVLRLGNRSLDGKMDEVSIYNYALSDSEIDEGNQISNNARLVNRNQNLKTLDLFIFYPNPSQGKVFFKNKELVGQQVQILDMVGKILASERINQENNIQLNKVPNGVYFLNVTTEAGKFIRRIIINR